MRGAIPRFKEELGLWGDDGYKFLNEYVLGALQSSLQSLVADLKLAIGTRNLLQLSN